MFDIGTANDESLTLFKINGAKLGLNDATVPDYLDLDMEVLWGSGDAGHDVELG